MKSGRKPLREELRRDATRDRGSNQYQIPRKEGEHLTCLDEGKRRLTSRLRGFYLEVEGKAEAEERNAPALGPLDPIYSFQSSTQPSVLDRDPPSWRVDSIGEGVDDFVAQHDSNP